MLIKNDQKMEWAEHMIIDPGQEDQKNYPSPEHLTKRLKKLLTIAARVSSFDFERVSKPEPTGINFEEKTQLTKLIADMGIDWSSDRPFLQLRLKIGEKLGKAQSEASERAMEKFVHQLTNESNRMVREYYNREEKKKSHGSENADELVNDFKVPKEKELKLLQVYADLNLVKFDPDSDGFSFGLVEAFKIYKRTIFFNFIRKALLAN